MPKKRPTPEQIVTLLRQITAIEAEPAALELAMTIRHELEMLRD